MKILTKYLCKEFIKIFVLCQSIFISIYLVIDFVQKIGKFINAGASTGQTMLFFVCKLPYIIVQMAPVATLISVIIVFSFMKKNNEIIALKSCGLSVFRFSCPIVVVSMALAIAVLFLSELVVPYASSRSRAIWNVEINKRNPATAYFRNHIWYKGADCIFYIRHYDSSEMIMDGPSFYFFDEFFHLIKKIDGWKAIWNGKKWIVKEGMIQVAKGEGTYDIRKFKEMELVLSETPAVFLRIKKKPEQMSYLQLKKFAKELQLEGYDATRYLVDMNVKLALPFINLVMALLAVPISLRLKKGRTALAVSMGIGVCFFYLLSLGFSRTLGLSGALPPMLSAWFANIIFLLLGLYLLIRVET
ncbi:MAG: LPS export ABC transporter permease LptG [Deltaproteobacteria bacterium]|nr:LPS export ABC transporter permease LptG [Deltaproteobacteria bacterium]